MFKINDLKNHYFRNYKEITAFVYIVLHEELSKIIFFRNTHFFFSDPVLYFGHSSYNYIHKLFKLLDSQFLFLSPNFMFIIMFKLNKLR